MKKFILNKKIIILITLLIPIFSFAEDDVKDALQQQFAFGDLLVSLIHTLLSGFDNVFKTNMSNALTGLKSLFIGLIYLHIMYEIAKTYLEGDYKELPIKICTLGFKYIAVGTFLGVIGNKYYFFDIPNDIMHYVLRLDPVNWAHDSPITTLETLAQGIYQPFDTTAALYVKNQFIEAFKVRLNLFANLSYLIIACCALAILIIDYIIITLGFLGILLKIIELTIALPIIVLLLAGKAIGIGEQYFNISMKYIISSIMDVAIIFFIAKLMQNFLNTLNITTMLTMLTSLFYSILYLLLLKIAPKIGSGIISGKPGVTMSDAQEVLSIGRVGVAIATGGAGVAIGAVAGATAGVQSGGGFGGAIKGAMSGAKKGAKSGAQNFASKANEAMK